MRRLKKLARLVSYPSTWRALLATRTAAAIEHMEMLRWVRPDTVIDVGANKGQFALASLAAGAHRVISFEPLDSEAALFERNLGDDARVRLHRFALAEIAGEAMFHVAKRRDSSSLLPIGPLQAAAFSITEARTVPVHMRRLDSVVRGQDLEGTVLLKVDVQGAETRVIRGATDILRYVRYLYAEGSFIELYTGQPLASELIRMLSDIGFVLRGLSNATFSPIYGPTQADLLFENRAFPLERQPKSSVGTCCVRTPAHCRR